MSLTPNLTRDQAAQRAEQLTVHSYVVDLDLTDGEGGPGEKTFRTRSEIRFAATAGTASWVDFVGDGISTATLNGQPLDVSGWTNVDGLKLPDLQADNLLVIEALGLYMNTGEGLHRFVDPVDRAVYLYSQFETADAKRMYACFDQPDLKATFTFVVTAPADWHVVTNGAPSGIDDGPAGSRVHSFVTTAPMSTYVTALVAGPYHVVTDHHDGISLSIYCRATLAQYLDADRLFRETKQGFDFYHAAFGVRYPFGKYDQLFVPEFNAGAMENAGAITFREEYVFRSRVTRYLYERRCETILHEMAHMWFGDLVTMRWWDDLWLKESFADFMGAFALVEATRYKEGWITFANRRKAWAYRADQLPSTHPVVADIRDLEDAKLNFDGITYSKGASVLKQLVAYVGRDAFLEAARRYFARHAYGNTTLGDLLSVLAETSGRDMAAWSRAWLETSGVNTLTPEVVCDAEGRITRLTVLQGGAGEHPVLRPHRIAVGLYRRAADGAVERYARAEADVVGAAVEIAELAGRPRPDLVLVNDDDLTYCKTRFDEDSLAALRSHLGDVTDPLARAVCWSAVWNLTRDGLMPARDYLDLVLRFAGRESDIGVLQSLHGQARTALDRYVAPAAREEAGTALAEGAVRALRQAEPGSGHQLAWANFVAAVAAAPAELGLLRGLLDGSARIDGLDVDQELRWTLLGALVAAGEAGADEVAAERRRDDTASGQRHEVRCLASRPDAEVKAAAWRAVVDSDELSNALVEATIAGFVQPAQRELLAPYAAPYFGVIEDVWAKRSIEIGMAVVRGLYPAYEDSPRTLEATDAWLAERADAAPALRRLVLEARDDLARALRAQECDARR